MSDSIRWQPPVIANREPRRAAPLTIADAAISATKYATGAAAASACSASIARLTVHGIVSDAYVPTPRHAMPKA